mmetsp:Transcript_43280/g.102974  ORF Transcript_43280/g.102974 Transcript_43280/m.102974 type:complete len:350 (+) Transcript_43280:327-1376(+)
MPHGVGVDRPHVFLPPAAPGADARRDDDGQGAWWRARGGAVPHGGLSAVCGDACRGEARAHVARVRHDAHRGCPRRRQCGQRLNLQQRGRQQLRRREPAPPPAGLELGQRGQPQRGRRCLAVQCVGAHRELDLHGYEGDPRPARDLRAARAPPPRPQSQLPPHQAGRRRTHRQLVGRRLLQRHRPRARLPARRPRRRHVGAARRGHGRYADCPLGVPPQMGHGSLFVPLRRGGADRAVRRRAHDAGGSRPLGDASARVRSQGRARDGCARRRRDGGWDPHGHGERRARARCGRAAVDPRGHGRRALPGRQDLRRDHVPLRRGQPHRVLGGLCGSRQGGHDRAVRHARHD